jgi:hypothetical protein
MGKGTGYVGDSGVRGFQRQEGLPETGEVDNATYQAMRKALIPTGPNLGDHILDVTAIKQINQAILEFSDEGKLMKIRAAMTDFMLRAEANEAVWHYTQARPFSGIGADPEQDISRLQFICNPSLLLGLERNRYYDSHPSAIDTQDMVILGMI